MAEIHYLPDPMLRQWDYLSRLLSEALEDEWTKAELDKIIPELKPAFLRWAVEAESGYKLDLSKGADAALQSVNDWVIRLCLGLLVELAQTRRELHQARST